MRCDLWRNSGAKVHRSANAPSPGAFSPRMSDNANSTSLNKYIANSGICSRREADQIIAEGRVTLNGEVARPGNRVEPGDVVLLDGKPLRGKRPEPVYLLYNKPRGIVCTTDRRERHNVIDAIDFPERIFPVGRLDKDSQGLLVLTNNGDIVNKMLRAGNAHEKEYIVTVDKPITRDFLVNMRSGVPILDTVTRRADVQQVNKKTFRIVLTQGLNRQIRRMCEHLGYEVRHLKRVRVMHLKLGDLRVGEHRKFTKREYKQLMFHLRHSSGEPFAERTKSPAKKQARRK